MLGINASNKDAQPDDGERRGGSAMTRWLKSLLQPTRSSFITRSNAAMIGNCVPLEVARQSLLTAVRRRSGSLRSRMRTLEYGATPHGE